MSDGRTILVVEDEPVVRAMLQRTLQNAGYTVLACGSGDEAVELSAALRAPIHLLVTDVVMRGMDGGELARRLTSTRPGLRVLFVSGYTPGQVGLGEAGETYLEKPFAPGELVERVAKMLE